MQKLLNRLAPVFWILLIYTGFLVYGASGHDDPHGNLWFAYTLREYGAFFNYNGDYVQQNTSLLQVFFTVLLSWILPFDLIDCGYLVEIIAAFICCLVLTKMTRRFSPALAFWSVFLMFSSPSFNIWIYGGMSTVLSALFLLLAVVVWWWYVEYPEAGLFQVLALLLLAVPMATVRPEIPVAAVAVSLFLLVLHWRDIQRRQRFLHILLISVLVLVSVLAWQEYYFSSWVPMPVQSKMFSFDERLLGGLQYLYMGMLANPMIPIALVSFFFILWIFIRGQISAVPWHRGQALLTLLLLLTSFVACYTCFIFSVGGDWMQAGRFMVPMVPIASLFVVLVLPLMLRNVWIIRALLVVLMFLGLRFTPSILAWGNHGVPIWTQYRLMPEHQHYSIFEKYNQEHLRDMAIIDHLSEIIPQLHQGLGRPVRLLSGIGGMTFYRLNQKLYGTGQLRLSDFRAYYDATFLNCPLSNQFGASSMGLVWTYPDYLSLKDRIKEECGVEPVDVIYDIDSIVNSFQPDFERAGYTLVHREEGYVIANDSGILADTLYVPNIIYVRNDLLPLLQHPELRVVDYKNIPLHYRPERIWIDKVLNWVFN